LNCAVRRRPFNARNHEEASIPPLGEVWELGDADRTEVTVPTFIVAFGVGAAALALWVDYRLAGARPSTLWLAMLHVGVAMGIAQFLVPAGLQIVGGATTALGAVFLVGLPASVYCLLAAFWVMRQVGDVLNSARQGPGSGARG
jgi:hypothetical protein